MVTLTRGAGELLGSKVADHTIRNWRQGTRYQPPLWAIEIVQAFLRRRAEHELAWCVEELEKEKAARSTARSASDEESVTALPPTEI
jgi:hypothetical protein